MARTNLDDHPKYRPMVALFRTIIDGGVGARSHHGHWKASTIRKENCRRRVQYVFEATEIFPSSSSEGGQQLYALKQIRCPEAHMLQQCRDEAAVHRACMGHANILPLLGFSVVDGVAYMLFPRMHRSLRAEINFRILDAPGDVYNVSRPPWNEVDVLNLFLGIGSRSASSSQCPILPSRCEMRERHV